MSAVAALLAALAVSLAWQGRSLRQRLSPPREGRGRWRASAPTAAVIGALVATLAGAGLFAGLGGLLLALAASALVVVSLSLILTGRRRRAEQVRSEQVVRGCEDLAGRLRVGLVPSAALREVSRDCPAFVPAAAEVAVGGSVAEALQRAAESGGTSLRHLASAWQFSDRTGASLVDTLEATAKRLAAKRELRRIVAAELAAPRATGRLLGTLPVVGVGLGYLLGGDPLGFLTGSLPGQACLAAGSWLAVAGVLWTESLADRATS